MLVCSHCWYETVVLYVQAQVFLACLFLLPPPNYTQSHPLHTTPNPNDGKQMQAKP